jgi:hypothetical protein
MALSMHIPEGPDEPPARRLVRPLPVLHAYGV